MILNTAQSNSPFLKSWFFSWTNSY